jgi:uncharacterized protein YciI
MAKYLAFYEMAPGAMPGLREHFPAHKARLDDFHARGLCLAAGPLGDPPEGAMGLYATKEAAEEFIAGDPFVQHGLVAKWRIVLWNAVFI